MKYSNDNTGNRTRDLLVCSAVPQPLSHQQRAIQLTGPHTLQYIYIVFSYFKLRTIMHKMVKVKVTLQQATKVQRWSNGIALLLV
jgi:hypothetical protein